MNPYERNIMNPEDHKSLESKIVTRFAIFITVKVVALVAVHVLAKKYLNSLDD